MGSYVYLLSPEDIENFTEESDVFKEFGSYTFEKDPESLEKLARAFERLPPREADMLHMYFKQNKYQADIGKIFNVSQGDVSYKIKRGLERIKFYMDCPELDEDKMYEDLSSILPRDAGRSSKHKDKDMYLKIMMGMYRHSCQSVVARELGIHQGGVRYRFIKGIEIIAKHCAEDASFQVYLDCFTKISENPNILRELKVQSRWKHKYMDVLI